MGCHSSARDSSTAAALTPTSVNASAVQKARLIISGGSM
jgi:hypothetical protein